MIATGNLAEKLTRIDNHWHPRIVAALKGQEAKLVRLAGEFVWPKHTHEDELFLCLKGRSRVELRDGEVEVLVFEPAGRRTTGNIMQPAFITAPEWL